MALSDPIPTASEQICFLLRHMTQEELRTELNKRRMKNGLRVRREAVVLFELFRDVKEKVDGKSKA